MLLLVIDTVNLISVMVEGNLMKEAWLSNMMVVVQVMV
jgi:hypothetical protein